MSSVLGDTPDPDPPPARGPYGTHLVAPGPEFRADTIVSTGPPSALRADALDGRTLVDEPCVEKTGTWRVRVTSFRDPVAAMTPFAAMLRVDERTAAQVIGRGGFFIHEGVSADEAERAAFALRRIGANARAEDTQDPRPSSEPPLAQPASAPPALSAPALSAERLPAVGLIAASIYAPSAEGASPIASHTRDEARGFWTQIPIAFVAPLLGKGPLFLLSVSVLGALGTGATSAPDLIVSVMGFSLFGASALGVLTETFAKVAQAALLREPGKNPRPHFALPDFSVLFFRGLATLFILSCVLALPVALASQTESPILIVLAALLPYGYWPMALTVQGISGRLLGLIDVPMVVRGIFAAPLEYFAISLISFAMIVGLTFATLVAVGVGVALGLHIALVGFAVAFVFFFLLAYGHAVVGYLMGALVRSKGEAFQFMTA